MKAVILCAGYGTRLYPLTEKTPKALLEVSGNTILDHIIHKIESILDINEITVISNDKFFFQFLEWAKQKKCDPSIKVINDKSTTNDNRLGALGDLQFYLDKQETEDDLLIIAGDNLFELDLEAMHDSFEQTKKTLIAAYDVKDKELAKQYGIVVVDKDSQLTYFEEKPEKPPSTLASTAIYMVPAPVVKKLKTYIDDGHSKDKIGSFFEWLNGKEEIYCYITKDKWYDIGTIEQLNQAQEEFHG